MQTANQKLNALFRVSSDNMNSDKCNKIQERYLRLMTNNYGVSYDELLDLTNEISPH